MSSSESSIWGRSETCRGKGQEEITYLHENDQEIKGLQEPGERKSQKTVEAFVELPIWSVLDE